jgi:hypothetical protein
MSLVYITFGPAITDSTHSISTLPVRDLKPWLPSVTVDQVRFIYAVIMLPRILRSICRWHTAEYPCPTLNFSATHIVFSELFFVQRFYEKFLKFSLPLLLQCYITGLAIFCIVSNTFFSKYLSVYFT